MRSSVTRIYNDKVNFVQYDAVKKLNVKLKLINIQTDLTTLDSKIAAVMFESEEDESVFEQELVVCEQYCDKIVECFVLLTADFPP